MNLGSKMRILFVMTYGDFERILIKDEIVLSCQFFMQFLGHEPNTKFKLHIPRSRIS